MTSKRVVKQLGTRRFITLPALPPSRCLHACARLQNPQDISEPADPTPPPPYIVLDADTVHTRKQEKRLQRNQNVFPIGSRRRRAVLYEGSALPFEQEPYQCFQEARKVLAADREEKLKQIEGMRHRIRKKEALPAENHGGEHAKQARLHGMRKHLEDLKILADINDPVIKKRFEDGLGDMAKPIYRYLADRKWRRYARLLLMQRIEQFRLVPEMILHVNPTASFALSFGRRRIQPGQFVDSRISEKPPRCDIQLFEKGERLVTIAVMDPDVPDLEKDAFTSRCHFLAINVPLSPTTPSLSFSDLSQGGQIMHPWLPPFAQKGSPYHRLVLFVFEQKDGKALDVERFQQIQPQRDGWTVKRMLSRNAGMTPFAVTLFRTQWDDGMDGVMRRAGIEGVETQFIRRKPEKNIYKKKDTKRYR